MKSNYNTAQKRSRSPSPERGHHNTPLTIRRRNSTEMRVIHRDISTMPQDQQRALLTNISPLPEIYLNQEDISSLGELNNDTNNFFRADNFFEDTVAVEPNDNDSIGTIDDTSNLTSVPDNEGQTITRNTLRQRQSRRQDRVADPDNEGQTITRDALRSRQDRVADPDNEGQIITRDALRRRQDRVADPDNEGQTITRNALRKRQNRRQDRVADPDNEGQTITRDALRKRQSRRQNRVADPDNEGQTITRDALRSRQDRVADPDNEGQIITRDALRKRQDRVADPDNKGQTITRDTLRQRQNRVNNRASVAQPLNSAESSPIGGFKDDGNCFNPQP
jgi:hypothetical protein